MSSSPTNGATKSKINLSVASLLSATNGDRLAANEKQSKPSICTVNSENFYREVSTCASTMSRNLPTVANSELLYKCISSSRSSPSQMPPLAPTRPQMVMTRPPVGLVRPIPSSVNYTVQQIYEQHGFVGYPNVKNPLSHIKTLTNTLTIPATQIQVSQCHNLTMSQGSHYQVKTMSNMHLTPASNITLAQGHTGGLPTSSIVYSRLSNSPLSSTTFTDTISPLPLATNGDMTISNVGTDDSSNYKCEVVSEGNIADMNIQECSSFDPDLVVQMSVVTNSKNVSPTPIPASLPTISKNFRESDMMLSSVAKNVQHVALVPKGWNRIIEKGVIIYISPNKSRIRSYDDMIEYLEAENTCKCGLECPVRPRELFNFDPNVSSKLSYSDTEPCCEKEIYCNTCKEFDNLMQASLTQKRVGRRRRRGRTKSTTEVEEKPASDRKKILLTGASPLEMFQSGMQAINALSDSQFKNYSMGLEESKQTASILNKFNKRPVPSSTSKPINTTTNDNSASLIQMLSNTLPSCTSNDNSGGVVQMLSNTLPGGALSVSLTTNTVLQNIQSNEPSPNNNIENNQISNVISLPNSATSFELPNTSSFQSITTPIQSIVASPEPIISSMQPVNSINKPIVTSPLSMSTSYESIKRSYQPITTSFQPTTSPVNISNTELNHIAADIIKSESVDMPFPSSLMGNKKRVRKSATKGRPRNKVADTYGDLPCAPIKKSVKKVLPDADIKKASELQLNDYLQHSAYLMNQANIQHPSAEVIPSLKTIHSDVAFVSRPQLVTAPSSSNESNTTLELQDIYKSLHVSVMAPQSTSTYNKISVSNLSSSRGTKTDISPSYESPPPNRTVNSTNQLPEALVNQLGYKFSSSSSFSHDNNIVVNKAILASNLKSDNIAVSNIVIPGRATVQQSTSANIPIVSAMQEKMLPAGVASTATTTTCSTTSEINNQPLNRPLQNVNISPNLLSSTAQPVQPDSGQQMLLLQFVTQNADQSKNTVTKVNAPIVRAYSMSHPQAYVHQGQSKFLLMGKSNASQTLATLAMQSKSNVPNTPPLDATKRTLQIQGLIPVQTNASQLSPRGVSVSHGVPVQYVTTVNPGLSIGNQNSERSYPVMQYIPPTRPAHVSYVYPATNSTVIRPTISSITSNYVRIAPAMQPIATTVNLYDIEKKKKEQELLESLQEQLLMKNSVISNIPQGTLCAASTFLTSVALSTSKVTHSDTLAVSALNLSPTICTEINNQTTIDASTTQVMIISNENTANITYNNNNNAIANVNLSAINISSNIQPVYSTSSAINKSFTAKLLPGLSSSMPAFTPITTTCIPSAVICSPHSLHSSENVVLLASGYSPSQSTTMVRPSTSNSSTPTTYSGDNVNDMKMDINEEIMLHCNEKATDLLLGNEDSILYSPPPELDCINSPVNDTKLHCSHNISTFKSSLCKMESPFKVGELVWVKLVGYPSWPGRVVSYLEAKKTKLNDGRVYVSWFGSNQINAVDLKQLKSFDEGFKGLDVNLTKRGYRANKKQLNELEKAIAAALEHSERNQGQHPVALNTDLNNL